MNDDARCGSKPARWRCRVFFTKKWMRHEIPEEPNRRGSNTSASLCLDGPTEKYGCIHPPHEKRTPTKCTKKLAAFRTLAKCHGPSSQIYVYPKLEERSFEKQQGRLCFAFSFNKDKEQTQDGRRRGNLSAVP
jgi:hypothetical protein